MEDEYVEKPWLRTYELGCIPETFEPYPEITYTANHLYTTTEKYPNELALVQLDYEMMWKELRDKVDRLATALYDMGIRKGDVVATCNTTSIQFAICEFGIPRIGATHCVLNPIDSLDGIVDKLERTNCETVICMHTNVKDRDVIDKIKGAKEKTKLKTIIVSKLEDFSQNPPRHEEEEGVIWLTDLLEKYFPNPPKVDIDVKKDPAQVFFTGGTTGRPKGVTLSHYNLVTHDIKFLGTVMPQTLLSKDDGLLHGFTRVSMMLPIAHLYGHEMFRMFISRGFAQLLQSDPRDTKEAVRLAKKYHPLMFMGSPTQYYRLLKEQAEFMEGFGTIFGSGSTALPPATQEEIEEKATSIVMQGYGTSELSGEGVLPTTAVLSAPFLGGKETAGKAFHILDRILKMPGVIPLLRMGMGLIGRENIAIIGTKALSFLSKNVLATPFGREKELRGTIGLPTVDTTFKVIDEDTGEVIPIPKLVKEGLRGEMCEGGPSAMLGYWPNVGDGLDEDGMIHTGDVIKMDEWGQVYVQDRTKDMINISGYKVYSIELDDMLYAYPGVNEAAVVGVPDPERPGQERVKAFVVPKPEYRGKIKEEEIIKFFREKVPPYAVPKSVEIRDEELPKTPTEKIFKKQLREEEIEKMKKAGVLK